MLGSFLPEDLLDVLRLAFSRSHPKDSERLDNIWLLSTRAFDVVQSGGLFFEAKRWKKGHDPNREQSVGFVLL